MKYKQQSLKQKASMSEELDDVQQQIKELAFCDNLDLYDTAKLQALEIQEMAILKKIKGYN